MPKWRTSVIVDASIERAYDYWSSPGKVSCFLSGVEKAAPVDHSGDVWRVFGVSGEISDLEVSEGAHGLGIGWKFAGDSCGGELSVIFEELWPERTRINIEDSRESPGGVVVKDEDLARFKDVVESEECLHLELDEGRVSRDLASASLGSLAAFGACAVVVALRRMRRSGNV